MCHPVLNCDITALLNPTQLSTLKDPLNLLESNPQSPKIILLLTYLFWDIAVSLIAVSSTKCDFCLLKGYLVMFWGVQLPGSPTKILLKTSFVPKPSPSQKWWATEASDEVSLALDLNSSFSSSNYQMVSVFCPGRSPFRNSLIISWDL